MLLDGRINFTIVEKYESYNSVGEPFIKLSMVTERLYGCDAYSIVAKTHLVGNNVFVRIFGVKESGSSCSTVLSRAQFSEKLALEAGEYNLMFSYTDIEDRYHLTVTDTSIQIEQIKVGFTSTEKETYWRFPERSFAYFLHVNTNSTFINEDFIDTLSANFSVTEFQFPDFGVIPFENSESGFHDIDFPARFFKYENDEDFEKTGEILKSYTKNVIGNNFSVSITLINWKNRRFTARQFMENDF